MEFNTLSAIPNLHQIKLVAKQLKGIVLQTPLQFSTILSDRFGANIFLKREDLQVVRSYKIRGAYHKIANIPLKLRRQGVVAASAGNHAQGVALACASLQIFATIFMPETTPIQKVEAVRFFGKDFIRIQLIGQNYDEAFLASRQFCEQAKAIYIPPFDDYDIIAGQATVALEIFQQLDQAIDYIFVPLGGGGLAAGTTLVRNELSPSTQLIGVEPSEAASMTWSLQNDQVMEMSEIDPFVDGASVKKMGFLTFDICRKGMQEILKIEKKELCRTMLDFYEKESILAEPAGALSVSGLKQLSQNIKGKTIVCVVSGGNFDLKRFPEIRELAKLDE